MGASKTPQARRLPPVAPRPPAKPRRFARFARLPRNRWWIGVAAAGAAAVVAVVFLLLPGSAPGRVLPPTRARAYTDFQACLLTDSGGIAQADAAPVWAGMEGSSTRTGAKVSYLSVAGPDTVGNAETYVNTLVERGCNVVLAVGDTQVAAAQARASAEPSVKFLLIGSASASSAANVASVQPGGDGESAAVQGAVTQDADSITVR
jgi:basic membrane lipoprotein Med (substrate-binding protein (PBP1-ABC) superfamily)